MTLTKIYAEPGMMIVKSDNRPKTHKSHFTGQNAQAHSLHTHNWRKAKEDLADLISIPNACIYPASCTTSLLQPGARLIAVLAGPGSPCANESRQKTRAYTVIL